MTSAEQGRRVAFRETTCEISFPFKVVFLRIISAKEGDAKSLDNTRGINASRIWFNIKLVGVLIPPLGVISKVRLLFFRKIDDHCLNLYLRRLRHFFDGLCFVACLCYRLGSISMVLFGGIIRRRRISPFKEVVLINRRKTIQAIWAKDEIHGLKQGCFSSIIVPDQNRMLGEQDTRLSNSSKVMNV